MIHPNFQNPPLILVVDDEKTLRLLLRRAMAKEGYRVAEAEDAEQCLAACQQLLPDMVLLDAILPGMDGFTCCARLQTHLGDDCPPVLMITALNDPASVDRGFEVGATDYITKPIHWAVLRQRVSRLLHSRWAMAQLTRQIERERLLTEQLACANQELQRLALVDGLTEVANRRCFDEYLHREWKRLAREQLPLSLILCDVDFFKPYNDTYGHQAGDECLRQIASAIAQVLKRPADLVARYGGEEFAVVLPNTQADGAVQVAAAIGASVRALKIAHAKSQCHYVTLSFGVSSTIPNHEQSEANLITAADKALYHAKETGRDRVVADSLPLANARTHFTALPNNF